MGLIAPPNYISPPAITGHRYGLYSIANMPDAQERWELGIQWEPLTGARAELRASECVTEYTGDVIIREGEALSEGVPFFVAGSYSCKSVGRPIEEAEERARLHLQGGEERAVEFAISNPVVGNEPSFAGATDLTPEAGAIPLVDAVALLQEALYETHHSSGAIHSPRLGATYFAYDNIAHRVAQHMETFTGTQISFGNYLNEGPEGEDADGNLWLYAGGVPTVRRGAVFTQPDETTYINKDDNDLVIIAQRPVMVTWAGPTFAVLADLTDRSA